METAHCRQCYLTAPPLLQARPCMCRAAPALRRLQQASRSASSSCRAAAAHSEPAEPDAAATASTSSIDAWSDTRAASRAAGAQSSIARDLGVNQTAAGSATEAPPYQGDHQTRCSSSSGWQRMAAAPAAPVHRPPEAPPESLLTSTSGFVWALAVLFSIRLSRRHTEQAAFATRSQDVSLEALINDQQLFRARREYEQREAAAKAAEAAERLSRAREEAAAKEAERVRRERQRAAEAAEAKRRADEAAAAQRQAFEAAEAASAALLAEKTAAAQREREERDRQLAAEREAQRRAEEERQRQLEAERRAREAEAARLAEEARAAREAERRALAKLARRFAVRLEGAASIAKPPPGAQTEGRLPREALLQLSVGLGTAVSDALQQATALYASLDDAQAGVTALAGAAARAAAAGYASTMRLQAMMGEGPLEHMDDVELQHWMNVAACRAVATATQALQHLLDAAAERVAPAERPLQVRTERGVLPEDHPERVSSRLERAIASVEAGRPEDASATLAGVMEDEDRWLYEGLSAPAPEYLGSVLALAHFLDRMLALRPARQADAPAWFESAAALIRRMLADLMQDAPQDSLMPVAAFVDASLGEAHPVAGMVRELAEANMSKAARAARREKQRAAEAALAAALVEEEWPDASELAAERARAREAATPVPERVWALRNVAATAAMGGPGGAARAVTLLEKALALKQEWVGSAEHPSLLPELGALVDVLVTGGEEWRPQEIATRERALRILSRVAARYRAAGHPASAVALLEAAVREHEQGLGLRHRGVTALTRRAEEWFEQLPPSDVSDLRLKVADARRNSDTIERVVAAFAEELVSATGAGVQRHSKADLWDQGGLGALPLLIQEQ